MKLNGPTIQNSHDSKQKTKKPAETFISSYNNAPSNNSGELELNTSFLISRSSESTEDNIVEKFYAVFDENLKNQALKAEEDKAKKFHATHVNPFFQEDSSSSTPPIQGYFQITKTDPEAKIENISSTQKNSEAKKKKRTCTLF